VYDKVRNNLEGVLKKWEIHFELRACEARYAWRELTKLTTGEKPKARYAHSTLVIDRSMFLWGGHAWERKSDLWRLDIDDLKWTKLDSSSHITRTLAVPSEKYGRALVITPWSILAFGGYAHTSFEPLVWRYDPFYMQWSQIPIEGTPSATPAYTWRSTLESEPNVAENFPSGRMLSSLSIIGLYDSPSFSLGVSRPKLLVFGGYDGIELLGDLWELDLRGVAANYTKKEDTERFEGNCIWRMIPGSTENNKWLNSCGSSGSGQGQTVECAINDILIRAICKQEYQSFSNF